MNFSNGEKTLEYVSAPRIELVGNTQCYIEGIKAIEEYSDGKIRINLGKLFVSFFGDGLYINSFSEEGAALEGTIITMEFVSND